jgi:hypothetical protein
LADGVARIHCHDLPALQAVEKRFDYPELEIHCGDGDTFDTANLEAIDDMRVDGSDRDIAGEGNKGLQRECINVERLSAEVGSHVSQILRNAAGKEREIFDAGLGCPVGDRG